MLGFIIWLIIVLVFAGTFLDIWEDRFLDYVVERERRIKIEEGP